MKFPLESSQKLSTLAGLGLRPGPLGLSLDHLALRPDWLGLNPGGLGLSSGRWASGLAAGHHAWPIISFLGSGPNRG